ncbi:glutathione S-transferase D1-like, partial [Nomia melanderi]|uniref:glutathione S-transferase D1-like n=1 Tax=Nomia melanderi TaxID=2448451 RepID=UPI003FCDEEDD
MQNMIDFYFYPTSPPCRAVILTARTIGLDMNYKELPVLTMEHITPELLKGLTKQDYIEARLRLNKVSSRPMMAYLMEKYGKDDSLYPKDLKKRAVINQRLFFDAIYLYPAFVDYFLSLFILSLNNKHFNPSPYNYVSDSSSVKQIKLTSFFPHIGNNTYKDRTDERDEKVDNALELLNTFLEGQDHVAGKNLTIADFSIVVTINMIEVVNIIFPLMQRKCKCIIQSVMKDNVRYQDAGILITAYTKNFMSIIWKRL